MRLKESKQPEVGVFFVIDGKVWPLSEKVSDAEKYGPNKSSGMHYDFFKVLLSVIPELKEDYELYPRGRVVYNMKNDEYIIIADQCILDDSRALTQIKNEFNLPSKKVKLEKDPHYVCPRCSDKVAESYLILEMVKRGVAPRLEYFKENFDNVEEVYNKGFIARADFHGVTLEEKVYVHPSYNEFMYTIIDRERKNVLFRDIETFSSKQSPEFALRYYRALMSRILEEASKYVKWYLENVNKYEFKGNSFTKYGKDYRVRLLDGEFMVESEGTKVKSKYIKDILDFINGTLEEGYAILHEAISLPYKVLTSGGVRLYERIYRRRKREAFWGIDITGPTTFNASINISESTSAPESMIDFLRTTLNVPHSKLYEWVSKTGTRMPGGLRISEKQYDSIIQEFIEYLRKTNRLRPGEAQTLSRYLKRR